MTERSAGLLLHPTSLPGRFGVGDLGPEAERFLAWAAEAGQSLWQVLPLGPSGPGDSPYGALSAFAGNPLLISPERLLEEALLPESALADTPDFSDGRFESGRVARWKEEILRRSWQEFRGEASAERRDAFEAYRRAPENTAWLADWGLFAALCGRYGGAGWIEWPEGLARREPEALDRARREFDEEIAYQEFLQFLFRRQWDRLRGEARRRGLALFGDVPIYVAHGSADVWAHRDLFALDDAGRPELVAGVPPDYFSRTGQLWGYPVYRWDRLEETGYRWWIERLQAALARADLVRIDHFRGFAAYWAVPAGETTAVSGRWLPGPGRGFFEVARRRLGGLPLVAEDLGTITDDVRQLLAELGFPGMRVLQFAFSEEDSPHLPNHYERNCVVYTGTHDNDTSRGWFEALPEEDRRRALDYLGSDGRAIDRDLIRAAYASVADRVVVPLQDAFGLGSEARMNTPSRASGNWTWRARREDFRPETAAWLRRMAALTGRAAR